MGSYTTRVFNNHWHKYTNLDRSTVARDGKLYSIADTGVITIRNPFTETDSTLDLSGIVGSSGRNLSIGMADDTYKAYVIAYSSTAAQRQIYEFADETFTLLENTYEYSNLLNQPPRRVFVVFDNEVWFQDSGYRRGKFKNNENPTVKTPFVKDGYNNLWLQERNAAYGYYGSVASKNGKLYWSADYYASSYTQGLDTPIWDMAIDSMAAHFNPGRSSGGSSSTAPYHGQVVFDPTSENTLLLSSVYNGVWIPKQAFTCFIQPADAPERPDGAGVKITYQLDVNY